MNTLIENQLNNCNWYKKEDCPKCNNYKYCLLSLPPNNTLNNIWDEITRINKKIEEKKELILYIHSIKEKNSIKSNKHNEKISMKLRDEIKDLTDTLRELRKDELRITKQLRIKRNRMIK
jgi:hypothetical protein